LIMENRISILVSERQLIVSPGQAVIVTNFDGKLLKRTVVEVIRGIVLICKDEEYEQAKRSRSLPWCVGFRREYVREVETHPSKAQSS
jgi:hypothetical protein